MASRNDLPTKTDLRQVINTVMRERFNTTELEELENKADAATESLTEFERTNKTYQKLVDAEKNALDSLRAERKGLQAEYQTDLMNTQLLVRTEGVTERSVAAVKALANKYIGTNL